MLRLLLGMTALAGVCFAQTADLAIVNAHVYTVDPRRPSASAIAVRGNKILAVADDVSSFIGPSTRRIDARGRAVVPGFIDSHGHMAALGASLENLDLRGIQSEDEIRRKVEQAAKSRQPGEWILGRGWDQNLWPSKQFPTKESIDAAAPHNPVVLTRVDGHAIWANTPVLALADVNAVTPDPPGGRIVRNASGKPTGVFIDRAMSLIAPKIPVPTPAQLQAQLERAAQVCVRDGLTTVHDAGIDAATLDAYRALIAAGRLPIRIYAMILVRESADLWKTYQSRGPEIGDFLTVRSLKLFADGALGSRGAALLEPYSDDPGNTGLLMLSREFIESTARDAVAHGFQVNTHAIGDRANRTVLQAYAAALGGGHNDKRFRVEHAQVVAPEDFNRFRDNSIVASMQPTHATSDMPWAAARLGPRRILGANAWQTLHKLGVHIAFGSDFPVEDPNPIWGFYSAITRQDHNGNPAGGWFPDQRFTRAEALRSWTVEGAYAAFEEDRKGSLAPGKLADFVMLSDDIMQIAPAAVWKAHVVMTVVDGKIAFSEQPSAAAQTVEPDPPASEVASGAYEVPAHEFRFISASIEDWPVTLACSVQVLHGAPVSVLLVTRREMNLFIRGQQPHALLSLEAGKAAHFRQAVPHRGDYDILLINDTGEPSQVRVEATVGQDRDLAQYVPPQRKQVVILASLIVFLSTVLWSGVSLMRVMRRGAG
jgi:hypothetical protein